MNQANKFERAAARKCSNKFNLWFYLLLLGIKSKLFLLLLNRKFGISLGFQSCTIFACGQDRLRLGNAQINLAFRSPCTIF